MIPIRRLGTPLLALLAGACNSTTGDGSDQSEDVVSSTQQPRGELSPWVPCPPNASDPDAAKDQCASLSVPVDYAAPGGKKVVLAVRRRPALDDAHRLGALAFNFGGPGESTLPTSLRVVDAVRQKFDMVGMDYRGLGQSTPSFKCYTDNLLARINAAGGSPVDMPSWMARGEVLHDLQQSCLANATVAGDADLLARIDTRHATYDLEALRAALETEDRVVHASDGKRMADYRLNFVGYSYGTLLGATYMTLYPHETRAFVLDSVFPQYFQSGTDILFEQMQGFELGLTRFFAWCSAPANACAFGANRPTLAAVRDAYDALSKGLDQAKQSSTPVKFTVKDADGKPVLLPDGTQKEQSVDSGDLGLAAISIADSPGTDKTTWKTNYSGWAAFGTALKNAELSLTQQPGADGGEALAGTAAGGWIPAPSDENFTFGYAEYRSLDFPDLQTDGKPHDFKTFTNFVTTGLQRVAPRTGRAGASEDAIFVGWPVQAKLKKIAIHAETAAPALIITGKYDPAAPAMWSNRLRDALNNHSKVLVHDTDGHARSGRVACLRDAVGQFLVSGDAPTTCVNDSTQVPWDDAKDYPTWVPATSN